MNIKNYLIDHSRIVWADLLDDWRWLVPSTAKVWLMNRFAELVLLLDDGSVSYLETSGGKLRNIARDKTDFTVAGMVLGANQCYGFILPPTLGGQYEVAN